MREGIIYIAINKINGKSYVGQTVVGLRNRIACHYVDSRRCDYAFSRALRKYKKDDWEWKILYKTQEDKIDIAEICAIYIYDSYYEGYNSTLGGEDNPVRYENVRKKISEAHKGKEISEETKQKISSTLKDRVFTKEHREKISKSKIGKLNPMSNPVYRKKVSDAHKGKTLSEEHKGKISKSSKGKKITDETKKKMSKAQQGKVVSQETKDKISKSLMGNVPWNKGKRGVYTKEVLKKMSESSKGKVISEEHKEKLRKANVGRKHSRKTKNKMSEKSSVRKRDNKGRFVKE